MNAKALLLAAALLASPLLAQAAPPAPPAPPMVAGPEGRGARLFPSMSEAGRALVVEAMQGMRASNDERARVEAAREKMLAALSADRFDAGALKAAMEEERMASEATHNRRQAAMLAAFTKLSPADRKAFATDTRAMKNRMADRMKLWSQRWQGRDGRQGGWQGRRGQGGYGGQGGQGMMPPPPPPPGPNGGDF